MVYNIFLVSIGLKVENTYKTYNAYKNLLICMYSKHSTRLVASCML